MKAPLRIFDKYTVLLFIALGVLGIFMMSIGADFRGLDLRFFYSGEEALQALNALTSEQRKTYQIVEFLDFLYILIYSSLLVWNLRKISSPLVTALGFLPAVFDVTENIGILYWLHAPADYTYLRWWGFVTLLKWSLGLMLTVWFFARFFYLKRQS